MNSPRIVVRYFFDGHETKWRRLVSVLAASIDKQCPDWLVDIAELPPPHTIHSPLGLQGNVHNTHKLDAWCEVVNAAKDGELLLLLDADTVILKPLDDVWDASFDLAYTVKPAGSRYPFNGGVIFLRVSDRTRAFMRRWRDTNRHFLEHSMDHQVWSPAFGGINQSALGMLLTKKDHGLHVRRLPCLEWNCEDEHWTDFNPKLTRIVHYKSALQRALFREDEDTNRYRAVISQWRAIEREITMATRPDRNMQVTSDELTNREQTTVHDAVSAAVDKYEERGQEAPEALRDVAQQTAPAPKPKLSRRARRKLQEQQAGGGE